MYIHFSVYRGVGAMEIVAMDMKVPMYFVLDSSCIQVCLVIELHCLSRVQCTSHVIAARDVFGKTTQFLRSDIRYS